MELKDGQGVKGTLTITKTNYLGEIVEKIFVPNLIVTVGKNFIASRMVGTTPAIMSHMAIGSGAVAPAVGDTALGTELGRVALSASSATGAVVTYTATFPAGTGTGAITEAGIFNAVSAGTMLNRTTFPVVNKGASDTIAISWTVTVQ
jgi:hypothetical protein